MSSQTKNTAQHRGATRVDLPARSIVAVAAALVGLATAAAFSIGLLADSGNNAYLIGTVVGLAISVFAGVELAAITHRHRCRRRNISSRRPSL